MSTMDWSRYSNPMRATTSNPTSKADETAVHELRLYIDSDRRFSPKSPEGQGRSVALNLLRKMKRGRYDHRLAPKGWMFVVDSAARAYAKEFSSSARDWSTIFTAATRRQVAQELADDFKTEVETGEYAHLMKDL